STVHLESPRPVLATVHPAGALPIASASKLTLFAMTVCLRPQHLRGALWFPWRVFNSDRSPAPVSTQCCRHKDRVDEWGLSVHAQSPRQNRVLRSSWTEPSDGETAFPRCSR